MSLLREVEVVQNPALGAIAIFQFSRAYYESSDQVHGPPLPTTLMLLPIILHEGSSRALHKMQRRSGLSKALSDYPELTVGLQKRMMAMQDLSLTSLQLALAAGLVALDKDHPWPRFTPVLRSLPDELAPVTSDTKVIVAAALRLGWWFSGESVGVLCHMLNVRL